jgi:8-amino-7-oxononanoate synthase
MSILKKCYDFTRVDEAKAIGMYPYFTEIEKVEGNHVWVGGKKILMVGSNNYLGLYDNDVIKEASMAALKTFGTSTCGSRFLNGTYSVHVEFEKQISDFMQKEDAMIFSTGFQTNIGTIPAIAGRNDVIIIDRLVHASILDAVRLSYADVVKYRHNDMEDLESKLQFLPEEQGKLIIVDGVFSIEGDLADLPGIVKLAKTYNAQILVDDAHGVGVMGKNGRGTAEHFGLEDEVDLIMTTFSKSFASIGGYVVGESKVIQYLKHHARAFIFSASITPASLGSARRALDIIRNEPQRRERLWEITRIMNREFTAMGYRTGNTQTAIIPVIIGDMEKTFFLWKALREYGLFVTPVVAPAVPEKDTLIRTSFTATLTDEDLEFILEGFRQCGKAIGLI